MADARADRDDRWTRSTVCGGLGIPSRSAFLRHGAGRHRCRLPDSRLLRRVHGARRRVLPLLRLHESLHVRHADAGLGEQYAVDVRGVGRRRPVQLLADRFLFLEKVGFRCGEKSVHRESHWGCGLYPRDSPRRSDIGHHPVYFQGFAGRGRRFRNSTGAQGSCGRTRIGPWRAGADRHRAIAVCRSGGEIGADSPVRLAPGRDGRADAGERAHPRGHDGDRGRVHGGTHERGLPTRAVGHGRSGDRGRGHRDFCGVHSPGAERHQEGAGVFDDQPARVHVSRAGRRRIRGGNFSSDDPCLLQGAAVPRRGQCDSRDVRGTGSAKDGRFVEQDSDHREDLCGRDAGDFGNFSVRRILQQR